MVDPRALDAVVQVRVLARQPRTSRCMASQEDMKRLVSEGCTDWYIPLVK